MVYTKIIQVESILGNGNDRCRRCGRLLTNPESIERGYGPVCWQKFELELWLGDVAIPEDPVPPTSHRTLDAFFSVEVTSHLVEGPSKSTVLAEG